MIKWAVVTSTTPFKVMFDGETAESSRIYKKNKNYIPQINDRVCFLIIGSNYICLGAYE